MIIVRPIVWVCGGLVCVCVCDSHWDVFDLHRGGPAVPGEPVPQPPEAAQPLSGRSQQAPQLWEVWQQHRVSSSSTPLKLLLHSNQAPTPFIVGLCNLIWISISIIGSNKNNWVDYFIIIVIIILINYFSIFRCTVSLEIFWMYVGM